MAEITTHYKEKSTSKKTRCGRKITTGTRTTDRYEEVNCGTCAKLIDSDLNTTIKSERQNITEKRKAAIERLDTEADKASGINLIAASSPQEIYGYLLKVRGNREAERDKASASIASFQDEIRQLRHNLKILCDTCPRKAGIPEQQRQRILYTAFADVGSAQSDEDVELALNKMISEVEKLYKGGAP